VQIKEYTPQFTEDKKIIPKQKFCASCKKRMDCDELYNKRKENQTTNQYEDMFVSMHYTCDEHEAIYIEFPILVNAITSDISYNTNDYNVGKYCLVSLNAENFDEDLHIGIYLGMLPISIISLYDKKSTEIKNQFNTSPAMFVPKFNQIFYGINMRWNFINDISDLDLLKDEPKEYVNLVKNLLTNK